MDHNRVEGTKHEIKGTAKEVLGKVTGNKAKEVAGKLEKNVGKIQKEVGKAADEQRFETDFRGMQRASCVLRMTGWRARANLRTRLEACSGLARGGASGRGATTQYGRNRVRVADGVRHRNSARAATRRTALARVHPSCRWVCRAHAASLRS